MSISILTLNDFGIANSNNTILDSVTLDITGNGIINILGSATTVTSTLFRALAGTYRSNPNIRTWGDVTYLGLPLGEAGYPNLVMQSTKLMRSSVLEYIQADRPEKAGLNRTQKRENACHILDMANLTNLVDDLDKRVIELPLETMRHLAIARVCAANSALIFIDEPTRNIGNDRTYKLLDYIKTESEKRVVMLAVKDKDQATYLSGRTIQLGKSGMQEDVSSPDLIKDKNNDNLSHIHTDINNREDAIYAPEGFILLKKGEISGYEQTLADLQKAGVTHLISSTLDVDAIVPENLAKCGITLIHEPIEYMDVPTVERASYLCEEIGHLLSQGQVVAIHCVPGFGSTGIVLALHLIWEGQSAQQAIDTVRKLQPEWMESEEHVLYLEEFATETA